MRHRAKVTSLSRKKAAVSLGVRNVDGMTGCDADTANANGADAVAVAVDADAGDADAVDT